MDNKSGVIYILTNPSFPDYVKIGYADDIDYVRAAALRKLVPYSLVDLFLREEPARVLGHIHGPYHSFFLLEY